MSSPVFLRILLAWACLGGAAAFADAVVEPEPPAAAQQTLLPPGMAQAMPVWMPVPFMPAPYYVAPQPLPQWSAPPGWVPYFMVLVPVVPLPAQVDYGPVADTPIVELPPPDADGLPPAPDAASPDAAGTAPANALAIPGPSESGALESGSVDYGPVADTPVVELPAFAAPAAAETAVPAVQTKPAAAKTTRKKLTVRKAASGKSLAGAQTPSGAAAPVKQRMCWSGGVVAPCRR